MPWDLSYNRIIVRWKTILFWLSVLGMLFYVSRVPGAQKFASPTMAKLLFFHLPCAFITTWFILLGAWYGMRYLQTGHERFDPRHHASVVMGLVFASLTMGSGIVFSYYQWGAFWHNDPRQTSFLVVLLLCATGVAIRGGIAEEEKAAKAGSAYSVATILPVLFLIFVLPRLMASVHPSDTIPKGKLDVNYWIGVFMGLFVLGWASYYWFQKLVASRTRTLADSDAAPVRPVPVAKTD